MAQKNRADLQIVIDTNLPDNTTDLITPVKHREVEEDLKDSNYNKLDDTAFDVNYTPTTPADWNVLPIEVGGALDELAKKNPSDNITYVATTGSDITGEFEVGNPLKPFLTINAAIDAVSSNGIVKVLGGSYTEDININKNGIVLDIQGINLTGGIFITVSNITIISYNAEITLDSGSDIASLDNSNATTNINVFGGNYNGVNTARAIRSRGMRIHDVKANQTSGSITRTGVAAEGNAYFYNCEITSDSSRALGCDGANNRFYNCDINSSSNTGVRQIANNTSEFDLFQGCKIEGEIGFQSTTGTANLVSYNSEFKGRTSNGVFLGANIYAFLIEGGRIDGFTDAVNIADGTNRVANTNNIIKDCRLYANNNIITEGVYNVADLGVFNLQNNMLNKALTYTAKVIDNGNNSVIVGLQQF